MMTLYGTLKIPTDATPEDVRAAYLREASETHPDTGGAPGAFVAVKAAYDVLYDPVKRRIYDETGLDPNSKDNTVELNAIGLIKKHAMECLGTERAVPQHIKEQLSNQRTQVEAQIAHIRRVIGQLEAYRARLDKHWHGPYKEAVLATVDANMESAKQQASALEIELKPVSRALEMIADVDWDGPVAARPMGSYFVRV